MDSARPRETVDRARGARRPFASVAAERARRCAARINAPRARQLELPGYVLMGISMLLLIVGGLPLADAKFSAPPTATKAQDGRPRESGTMLIWAALGRRRRSGRRHGGRGASAAAAWCSFRALFAFLPGVAPPPLSRHRQVRLRHRHHGAAIQYARSTATPWSAVIPCMLVAFVAALAGAYAVTLIPAEPLKKALPFILAALLIYTWASGAGKAACAEALAHEGRRHRVVRQQRDRLLRRFPGGRHRRLLQVLFVRGLGFSFLQRCGAGEVHQCRLERRRRGRVRGHRVHLLGTRPVHGGREFRGRASSARASRCATATIHPRRVLRRGFAADRQDLQGRLPLASARRHVASGARAGGGVRVVERQARDARDAAVCEPHRAARADAWGATKPSASASERRREAFARDLGRGQVRAAGARRGCSRPASFAVRLEIRSGSKALQTQLARVGAAVDLAVEEHVAGLDAQAVGGGPAAFAQAVGAPGVEQLLAQRRRFGARDQQLVAELAAEAQARDDQVAFSRKRK